MLTEAEKRRYYRHIMLKNVGLEGQEKLKRARVLVVGTGGLGAPVLQYLTAAGTGVIGIMDDDVVNEDNLHRQILYGGHDLGKLKTIIARERLRTLNPFVEFELMNIRLKVSNALQIIGKFDLVIDATDNFSTRYLINDACLILNKPWVFGAVYKFEGQMSVFNYNEGQTLNCLYHNIRDKQNVPNPPESGLFGVVPGIIGSFQAVEAIKIITGIGDVLCGKVLIFDFLTNRTEKIEFPLIEENRKISGLKENY
ncbi:MAG: HesA/MoeB/ThiF family protein [Bacteroidota bacterium]